jgi:phenylalanyl-tRNA synthetase alpha subunit
MKEMINTLLNGMTNEINELNEVIDTMSNEAIDHATEKISNNLSKYKKLAKAQQPKAILKVLNEMKEQYPVMVKTQNKLAENKSLAWKDRAMEVYQYDKAGNLIETYSSINEAHRISGIADSSICYCCKKKKGFKSAGGYIWRYATDEQVIAG